MVVMKNNDGIGGFGDSDTDIVLGCDPNIVLDCCSSGFLCGEILKG